METYEEIKKYVESLKENETIQIYNQKTSKLTSYIIQFKQLISYLNFESELKEKLSNPDNENLRLKDIYLIDKRWFNSWKKHVGYESAEKFYNNYKFREELNDSDYDTIYSIINNNSSNSLYPLDNTRLYNNGELKLDSEFILVDRHCYNFFSLGSKKSLNQLNKSYEILIFFEKIFLIIDEYTILLIFKENTNKAHFELLIKFNSPNFNKDNFFIQLGKKNIVNWLKRFNFDLFSTKELPITNGPLNFNIINKTLIIKEQASFTQIYPSNNNLESQGKNHKISNEMLQTLASIQKNIEKANKLNLTEIGKPNKIFKNILKSNEEKLETTQNFLKKNFFNKTDINDINNMNPLSSINLSRKINSDYLNFTKIQLKGQQNQMNFDNINSYQYSNNRNKSNISNSLNNMNSKTFNNNEINYNKYKFYGNNNSINNNSYDSNTNFNNNNFNNNLNSNGVNNINININVSYSNNGMNNNNMNNNNNFNNNLMNNCANNNLNSNSYGMNFNNNNNINFNGMNNMNNMNNNYNQSFSNSNNNFNYNNNINNNCIPNSFVNNNNLNNFNYNNNGIDNNNSNINNNFNNNNNFINFNNNFNNDNNYSNNNASFNNSGCNNQNMNNYNMNMNQMTNNMNMNMNNNMLMNNNMNMNNMNNNSNMQNNNMNMNMNNNMNMNMNNMNNNMNMNMNNMNNIPNNNINMFNHNMNIQGNGCNNNNIFNNGNQNNAMLGNFQINNNMMNINQNNNLIQNTHKLPPHQVGLENIGQTCYMNASLQILTNIQSLTDPLLQKMSQNCINSTLQPLTFVFTLLTFQLKTSNQKYINPKIFKSVVGQLNPLFKGIQASDSKDFIFFIIERLHEELKPQNIPQNNNIINYAQQEIESRNEPLTYNKFINEYNKEITIIRNLFHGITRSTLYCDGCKNKKYSFQVFNILNFVLKKVYEVKNHILGGFLPENHPITLYDAFEAENKQEDLVGENMIFCNTCQALKSGWNKQELHTLPQILFIVLNRGKNNQDFRGKFTFDEKIVFNHNNLTFNLINPNSYKRYFLCGIVTHLGSSDSNGHFISYFRSDINQQFYCYNDASVAKVSILSAMKSKISDIVEEDIVPYILFYHQY